MGNELTLVNKFQNELALHGKEIRSMLPEHVGLKKFQRVTMTAIQMNPSIAGKAGLMEAVLGCAKDGLIPDGKEAALVPFKGKITYMPMVGGILKKIRQSGELKSLTANVIIKGDTFKSWTDENGPHFTHEPDLLNDSAEVIGAYAVAVTKDGGSYFEVLKKSDIEKIRKSSASQDGPWKNWYNEMAKKSAIRRLAKRLPMSTDLEGAILHDDQFYDIGGNNDNPGKQEPVNVTDTAKKNNDNAPVDVTPQKKGTSPEQLEKKLEKKQEEKKEEPKKPAGNQPEIF